MDPSTEIERILDEDGAKVVRRRKHRVYKLSNGQTFTRASTPGDWRSENNSLHQLKRALGLNGREKPKQETQEKQEEREEMKVEQMTAVRLPEPPDEQPIEQPAPTMAKLIELPAPPPAEPSEAAAQQSNEPVAVAENESVRQIKTAIAQAQADWEAFSAQAEKAEKRAAFLTNLLPLADNPLFDELIPILLGRDTGAAAPTPPLVELPMRPPMVVTSSSSSSRRRVINKKTAGPHFLRSEEDVALRTKIWSVALSYGEHPFTVAEVSRHVYGRTKDSNEQARRYMMVRPRILDLVSAGKLMPTAPTPQMIAVRASKAYCVAPEHRVKK